MKRSAWDNFQRRYDDRGRLLYDARRHTRAPELAYKRWIEPVLSPVAATQRITALEGWLEYAKENPCTS